METNEILQLILGKLEKIDTRLDGLEIGQLELKTELATVNTRLDGLEAGQQRLDKRMSANAKDTAEFFHMQTDYLTTQFKTEISRIEIRIEHELFDKIQSLYEGYKMIREHLNIA